MINVRCYALVLPLAASLPAQATDYRFDTIHTQVFFSASHLGLSNPLGRLRVKSGFIRFDAGDWTRARVEATLESIDRHRLPGWPPAALSLTTP